MQGNLSVERMCSLVQVSRAGFYRALKTQEPDLEEMELRSTIQRVVVQHRRRYGYRRVTAELRQKGLLVNHKRVVRLMRLDNLLALRPSAFVVTTDSDHDLEIYVNLAKRMQLTGINQLWMADITFIRLQQEFVYLAVILDAYSRKVVGWALDRSLATRVATAALQSAITTRSPPPGLVHHSDRGIQYASSEYGKVLDRYQIVASMSRLANPWDNAKCESFMKTLKQEEIYANEYRDLEHLQTNLAAFIERYYNTQRLHSALDYRSPEGFEQSIAPGANQRGPTVSFSRHGEIFQSDVRGRSKKEPPESGSADHRFDESPTGYSSPGWSPPEPGSASPVKVILKHSRASEKKK
jgi:putative transposase